MFFGLFCNPLTIRILTKNKRFYEVDRVKVENAKPGDVETIHLLGIERDKFFEEVDELKMKANKKSQLII